MSSPEAVGRPMEILLVEDSLSDAQLAIEALKDGGVKHRLTLVRDGQEALNFLRRVAQFARAPRPDLVLLDLSLPRIDGREVLASLRETEDLAQLPVVVLTASSHHEDYLKTQMLDVDAYLIKPVDMEKFITVVRE